MDNELRKECTFVRVRRVRTGAIQISMMDYSGAVDGAALRARPMQLRAAVCSPRSTRMR